MTYEIETIDGRIEHCQKLSSKRSKDAWADWQVDILKSEWLKGTSASQIGLLINKTKNAVIGKSHRMPGFEPRGHSSIVGRPKQERPPRKPREPEKIMTIIKKATAPRFYPAAVPLTTKAPISIMELNAGTCRAIVGYGANGLAVYCGDMTFHEKPFCEGHCAMYYQPLDYRRRAH